MLQLTPSTSTPSPRYLAQLRRIAERRGFRILKDWTGTRSLIDAEIEPPRALMGLWHVSLNRIEAALMVPLPPPKTRVRKVTPKVTAKVLSVPIVDLVEVEGAWR